MRYYGVLTIPAGTAQAVPASQVVALAHGMITEVSILFPPGHGGLTYLQVWHGARQIFPLSPGEAFRGDDHTIEFNERYEIVGVPYWVDLRGWAPDAALNHTIEVSFTVLPLGSSPITELGFVALPEGF